MMIIPPTSVVRADEAIEYRRYLLRLLTTGYVQVFGRRR